MFEDNHLIAINKQPGQLVQGDKTGDDPLSELVKEYIKIAYSKPGKVYLGVIHRLDRPTSGVVIFAKTSKALTRMNLLFSEKKTQKTYWAVVKNKPQKISNSSPIIWCEIPNKTNPTLIKKQFQIAKKPSYPIKLRFLFNAILCWKLN